jgi:hypothetical protein
MNLIRHNLLQRGFSLGELTLLTACRCRARSRSRHPARSISCMRCRRNPQTLMAFNLADETLPREHGFPFKLRIPTKLGFKNPKFVTTLYVTDKMPRGYWSDRGYNWFSGS